MNTCTIEQGIKELHVAHSDYWKSCNKVAFGLITLSMPLMLANHNVGYSLLAGAAAIVLTRVAFSDLKERRSFMRLIDGIRLEIFATISDPVQRQEKLSRLKTEQKSLCSFWRNVKSGSWLLLAMAVFFAILNFQLKQI